MASESQFLRAVMPSMPTEISTKLRSLCAASPANESALENLIRLLVGGTAAPDASNKVKEQWAEKQAATKVLLAALLPLPTPSGSGSDSKKRSREDSADADADEHDSQQLKKPRLAPSPAPPPAFDPGAPLFTLHSISTTSPIRKKVDTTIHAHAVVMTHPTSKTIEAVVPTTFLRRAFILPTRGKTKPHWTVVLLSGDVPDAKGKSSSFSSSTGGGTSSGANGVSTSNSENQQIIFGIDAITTSNSSFSTTTYPSSSSSSSSSTQLTQPTHQTLTKGSPTLPSIHIFLSHLPPTLLTPPIEPSSQGVFKSACPGILGASATLSTTSTSSAPQGIPGVEAYRGAKPGNLWFAKEGVLWGESKPCEFWAVGDLLGSEGLRVVGVGRTCSVILTRRVKVEVQVREGKEGKEGGEEGKEEREGGEQEGEAEGEEEEEEMGEETEFGMIDSKEREGIYEWTRNHRHLFFHPSSSSLSGQKPIGNRSINGKEKDKEKEIAPSKSTYTSSKPSTLTSTSASKSTSKLKSKPKLVPSKSTYPTYTGPQTIRTIHNLSEDEDEEDEDFGADVDVDDLDGSERSSEEEEEEESSSSSDEGDEDEGEGEEGQEGQDEDEDAESDEDGAGAGGGTGGEADADVDLNAGEDEDELDELDQLPLNPAHHPLLRPGAMPKRMSKAAVQMVVGIVEGAFLGGGGGGSDGGVNATADEEHEEEQDELEDELELKDELDE